MDEKEKMVPLATLDAMDRLGMDRTEIEPPSEERKCVVCGKPIPTGHETVMRFIECHVDCEHELGAICVVKVEPKTWEPRKPDKYGCPTIPNFYGCLGCEAIGKCYTLTGQPREK